MNSLTQYESVRDQLQPGDVIVFWGTGLLSDSIEKLGGGPSHTAVVRQGAHPLDIGDAVLIESSIEGAENGVQTHSIGTRVAGYDPGGSIAALLLDNETRGRIDWEKFYAFCGRCDGIVKYDIRGLLGFLLPEALERPEPTSEMVCSVFAGALLNYCGAAPDLDWGRTRPEDLVKRKMYRSALTLYGNPPLKDFNTL